jgi:hypothetical protein
VDINGKKSGVHASFSDLLFSDVSVFSSSIGSGGGVVAIVHPIQAPMNIMAGKAANTAVAMAPNWICSTLRGNHGRIALTDRGAATMVTYPTATIKHAMKMITPKV